MEHANASNWQNVQDLWSWITNLYQRFQRTDHGSIGDSLIWLVPPLTLLLVWRLRSRLRSVRTKHEVQKTLTAEQGRDSELYRLSALLGERGFTLREGETLKTYLMRTADIEIAGIRLGRLLELHYRYRFAHAGLSSDERDELRIGAEKYCQQIESG